MRQIHDLLDVRSGGESRHLSHGPLEHRLLVEAPIGQAQRDHERCRVLRDVLQQLPGTHIQRYRRDGPHTAARLLANDAGLLGGEGTQDGESCHKGIQVRCESLQAGVADGLGGRFMTVLADVHLGP